MSIHLGGNFGKFFEGLLHGGLVAEDKVLGTSETLITIQEVAEGIGGGNIVIQRHVSVVLDDVRQATNLNTGEGELVNKFAIYILAEGCQFGRGERDPYKRSYGRYGCRAGRRGGVWGLREWEFRT